MEKISIENVKPSPVAFLNQEFDAMVNSPTNVVELLRNIKTSVDSGALLDSRFYSDSNIKKWYSESGVTWQIRNDTKIKIDIARSFTWKEKNKTDIEQIITRTVGGDGAVKAKIFLILRAHCDDLSFESVQTIFGSDWEYDEYIIPPGRVYKTPTHKMGNARIKYLQESVGVKSTTIVEFNEDGTLYNVSAEMGQL